MTSISKSRFLKKTLQFLLSALILSFLHMHYSLFSVFTNSFNLYFSFLPFNLMNYTIDRNYLFLICNGILVFLATSSRLVCPSQLIGTDLHDENSKTIAVEAIEQSGVSLNDEAEREDETKEVKNEAIEEESRDLVANYEEDEDEDEEGMTTEELNKKFEEFIRVTREEIRIEAQRQLVMV